MIFSNLYALGTRVSIISDIFRVLFFYIDSLIYSLIPGVGSLIYSLYDITSITSEAQINNIIKSVSDTVYSFLAVVMFFRLAFSLIQMLVDPDKISDKEKGAGKLAMNVVICLALIIFVPTIFKYARKIETKIIDDKIIEKLVIGKEYGNKSRDSFANDLALSVWSIFLSKTGDAGSAASKAYDKLFNSTMDSGWDTVSLSLSINNATGFLGNSFIGRWGTIPFNKIANGFGEAGSHYEIAYVWLLSTIVGGYVLWTFIKFMIDVAYRSIKFFALEILSPIAIVSYIDPSSSKKGMFNKWLNETVKTYIGLFVRIFVFAFASVLLNSFSLNSVTKSGGLWVNLFFILAAIAFIKTAPKFIDNLFGTTISKDSDTKGVTDMLRGGFGAVATGVAGGISGAVVAKKTGNNMVKGALGGTWQGMQKGYNAGKKGDMLGVVTGGYAAYQGLKKSYGYNANSEKENDIRKMVNYVPAGKKAKNEAISRVEGNNFAEIKQDFAKKRNVNGYDVNFSNLINNADARGKYKQYAAGVAEREVIPGVSDRAKQALSHAAYKKYEANLMQIEYDTASADYNSRYSAFMQRDEVGQQYEIEQLFNAQNARLASEGKSTFDTWQDMYETTDMVSAYSSALDEKIKVDTGHSISEWSNIATKAKADADDAENAKKAYFETGDGIKDKKKIDDYSAAKGVYESTHFSTPDYSTTTTINNNTSNQSNSGNTTVNNTMHHGATQSTTQHVAQNVTRNQTINRNNSSNNTNNATNNTTNINRNGSQSVNRSNIQNNHNNSNNNNAGPNAGNPNS